MTIDATISAPTGTKPLTEYREEKPRLFVRLLWMLVNYTVFRILVGVKLHFARNFILRCFGAQVPNRALIYSSVKIFAPWNLEVGRFSTIGPNVEIYNKALVVIGENAIVSQRAFLCTASHDVSSLLLPLKTARIIIEPRSWIGAEAFVGPGVTIGEGAVVGARGAVFKSVPSWTVVGGNPAKFLRKREIVD